MTTPPGRKRRIAFKARAKPTSPVRSYRRGLSRISIEAPSFPSLNSQAQECNTGAQARMRRQLQFEVEHHTVFMHGSSLPKTGAHFGTSTEQLDEVEILQDVEACKGLVWCCRVCQINWTIQPRYSVLFMAQPRVKVQQNTKQDQGDRGPPLQQFCHNHHYYKRP